MRGVLSFLTAVVCMTGLAHAQHQTPRTSGHSSSPGDRLMAATKDLRRHNVLQAVKDALMSTDIAEGQFDKKYCDSAYNHIYQRLGGKRPHPYERFEYSDAVLSWALGQERQAAAKKGICTKVPRAFVNEDILYDTVKDVVFDNRPTLNNQAFRQNEIEYGPFPSSTCHKVEREIRWNLNNKSVTYCSGVCRPFVNNVRLTDGEREWQSRWLRYKSQGLCDVIPGRMLRRAEAREKDVIEKARQANRAPHNTPAPDASDIINSMAKNSDGSWKKCSYDAVSGKTICY